MENTYITVQNFSSPHRRIQILGYKHRGARATIYLGKLDDLTLVVVKELRGGRFTSEEAAERLGVYATRGRMYAHPNVDAILGVSNRSDHLPFVVSRNYSRNIIEDLVANPGQSNEELVDMIKGFVGGLCYIHSQGTVHGNIHEDNLLADENGKIIICDTAFSSTLGVGCEATGIIPRNYRHMPHERLISDEDSAPLAPESKAADIYAIALCIIQMWTLDVPFSNLRNVYQVLSMLRKLQNGEIAHIERPVSVPGHIWGAISDCLSVNPQDRPTAAMLLARF